MCPGPGIAGHARSVVQTPTYKWYPKPTSFCSLFTSRWMLVDRPFFVSLGENGLSPRTLGSWWLRVEDGCTWAFPRRHCTTQFLRLWWWGQLKIKSRPKIANPNTSEAVRLTRGIGYSPVFSRGHCGGEYGRGTSRFDPFPLVCSSPANIMHENWWASLVSERCLLPQPSNCLTPMN